jgi:hypothetical protein
MTVRMGVFMSMVMRMIVMVMFVRMVVMIGPA